MRVHVIKNSSVHKAKIFSFFFKKSKEANKKAVLTTPKKVRARNLEISHLEADILHGRISISQMVISGRFRRKTADSNLYAG